MWRLNTFYAGKETTKFLTVFFAEFLLWKHDFKRLGTGMWTWQWLGSKLDPVNDSVRRDRGKTQWGGMIPPIAGGLEAERGQITYPQWSSGWVASQSFKVSPAWRERPCFAHHLSDESKKQPACVHAISSLWLLTGNRTKWSHLTWLFAKEGMNQSCRSNLEKWKSGTILG